MNIVCFARSGWNEAPASLRLLLSRLARRGHRVLIIEAKAAGAPVTLRGALRWRSRCRIRQVHDGLHVLTPRPLGRFPGRVAQRLRRMTIAAAAENLGQWAPVVLCAAPEQAEFMRAVKPSASIYFAEGGVAPSPQEVLALRKFDMVLAALPAALGRWASLHPITHLLEYGIDPAEFAPAALAMVDPHPAIESLARPRIGFVGAIDESIDQELIVRLARRFANGAVVLAGPVKEGLDISRLREQSEVHFTGPLAPGSLARVYRELDAVVLPVTTAADPEIPARLFECLAAGLPVIATALPDGHAATDVVSIAQAHDEFLAAVARELEDPDRLAGHRRAAAEAASWQRRADQLEEHLRQAIQVATEKRKRRRLPSPRPDRHGRQVVGVEPRLDGKDSSVRLLHDNYVQNGLSTQQHLIYLATRIVGLVYWGLRVPIRLLQGKGLVRRILVVRNGHLGDTVVFLPTLAALRRRYPHARITVALAPDSGARLLLDASPLVDEVMPLDFFNRSRWDRFRGAIGLLAHGFDMIVGGVWYFHLPEAVYSGAVTRLGLYDGHPLQRYADRVVMLDPTMHEAENNLRLIELVTGSVPLEQEVPRLMLDEPALKQQAAQMRQKLGVAPDAPVVAMHPGSKRPSRRWPPEGFAELAEGLLRERRDLQVVFTGAGREEQELIARIRALIPADLRQRTHDSSPDSDLLSAIGFYDTCKLLVCNDTGVMHVARARGVALIAIIGPENDRRWGPHPLGPGPAVIVRNQVPGTPHGKWECGWNLSLASIDAPRIKRHCDAILDGAFATMHNLKPIEAGSERLYPLVRDFRRLSFAQLQELGLELPRVALVLVADPALLGSVGRKVTAVELAAAARDMRRQHYPRIQTLLVVRSAAAFRDVDIGHASLVRVEGDDPDAAWAAVLGGTDARLFWPAAPGRLEPTAVSNRVAVFLRGPNATVVDDQRAWHARALIDSEFVAGPWMIERATLEKRLVHPLPHRSPAEERPAPLPLPDLAVAGIAT